MLYEKLTSFLKPIQTAYATFDDDAVIRVINAGTDKVRQMSEDKIADIKKKVGFFLG